jgi:hypothetical protein
MHYSTLSLLIIVSNVSKLFPPPMLTGKDWKWIGKFFANSHDEKIHICFQLPSHAALLLWQCEVIVQSHFYLGCGTKQA